VSFQTKVSPTLVSADLGFFPVAKFKSLAKAWSEVSVWLTQSLVISVGQAVGSPFSPALGGVGLAIYITIPIDTANITMSQRKVQSFLCTVYHLLELEVNPPPF